MNNNIMLDRPKIKFESHLIKPPDFPFIIRQPKDHRASASGIHESLEPLCFLDGEGAVLYDGVPHSVRRGDIIIVNAYAIHQVVSQAELPAFCLIIDRQFCQYNGIDPNCPLFQSIIRDDEQMTALFRQMMDAYADKEDRFCNAAFKCAVLELLLYFLFHKLGSYYQLGFGDENPYCGHRQLRAAGASPGIGSLRHCNQKSC